MLGGLEEDQENEDITKNMGVMNFNISLYFSLKN